MMHSLGRRISTESLLSGESDFIIEHEPDRFYLLSQWGQNFNNYKTDDRVQETIQTFNKEESIDKSNWSALWRLWNAGHSWFIVCIIGVSIGASAYMLSVVTSFFSDIRRGHCLSRWFFNEKFCCMYSEESGTTCTTWVQWSDSFVFNYLVYAFLALIFIIISAIVVKDLSPLAAGSGISEIKAIINGFSRDDFVSFRVLLVKCVCLPLTIASGLSVGKEGPSVHLATAMGHVIASIFKRLKLHSVNFRDIYVSSAAAGVAVAFGSPIGGVLFGIEEMASGYTSRMIWYTFSCCLFAVATLHLLDPFRTGQLVLFEVRYSGSWHFFELFYFSILGIFGGFYGEVVMRLFFTVQKLRKVYVDKWPVIDASVVVIVTALISYFNTWLKLDMTLGMELLFQDCKSVTTPELNDLCNPNNEGKNSLLLLTSTLLRMIFVSFSYGVKVPAGIFVPSMAVGATFGRMVGLFADILYRKFPDLFLFSACHGSGSCITPGTYALLGAAASLSGMMHLTMTVVVIMFELTGALNFILPTVLVVAIANAVGALLGRNGIADRSIKLNGIPFQESENIYSETEDILFPVTTIMSKTVIAIPSEGITWRWLFRTMKKHPFSGYPVVNNLKRFELIGYIKSTSIKLAFEEAKGNTTFTFDQEICFRLSAVMNYSNGQTLLSHSLGLDLSSYMDLQPISVLHNQLLSNVSTIFQALCPKVIHVEKDGILVGLITRKDLLLTKHYLKTFNRSPSAASRMENVPLHTMENSEHDQGIELQLLRS
ncbi:ClC chloride channel [Schizosaccharomyces cryophilus OY26]|uniref:Chloride channel protein n=1 Tax=Schizosaccharomyces cryophilus (strain OY26 / ATCC MYA-4695 / CBS 11777 / NBRC 106824 / NRRL Y48691) TaxID=653667 RepID=S9W1H1_SCHCR|nr:ClC chloride channel [Schizosaccharomyces cryophilus OY26]EPY53828.1 ClC chloride channel [Schizosaccharomyces cryophilus OY26]